MECVEFLIEIGAKPLLANKGNMSFLLCAVAAGSKDVLQLALDKYPGLVSSTDINGRNIFHYIADLLNASGPLSAVKMKIVSSESPKASTVSTSSPT